MRRDDGDCFGSEEVGGVAPMVLPRLYSASLAAILPHPTTLAQLLEQLMVAHESAGRKQLLTGRDCLCKSKHATLADSKFSAGNCPQPQAVWLK